MSRLATLLFILSIPLLMVAFGSPDAGEPREAQAASLSSAALEVDLPQTPPASCPVTLPASTSFSPPQPFPATSPYPESVWYGSDELWTLLPRDGTWPGLRQATGDYVQKIFWWRADDHWLLERIPPLTVTGTRLDAPAPGLFVTPATHGFHHELQAFMLVVVNFPTPGCWEITGQSQGRALSFVVWVAS